MAICGNKGCGKEFQEEENGEGSCIHHPGGPVFHEGLKGWSCCKKRVTSFDEFMSLPGCSVGKHQIKTEENNKIASKEKGNDKINLVSDVNGVEIYNTGGGGGNTFNKTTDKSNNEESEEVKKNKAATVKKKKEEEEENLNDPEGTLVEEGTQCKRKGCSHKFSKKDEEQKEKNSNVCVFHSGEPIFHEGSKGWSCCSRKVLEFDEFLKIKGCKSGKHRYTDPNKKEEKSQVVECRSDWYQTQTQVILSIFAKQVVQEKTKINFYSDKLSVHIEFQNGSVFEKDYDLFLEIAPEKCSFSILSVKIEIKLVKSNGLSWANLEKTAEKIVQWTTFGVQGRVGTVGGKEVIYAGDSPIIPLKK